MKSEIVKRMSEGRKCPVGFGQVCTGLSNLFEQFFLFLNIESRITFCFKCNVIHNCVRVRFEIFCIIRLVCVCDDDQQKNKGLYCGLIRRGSG